MAAAGGRDGDGAGDGDGGTFWTDHFPDAQELEQEQEQELETKNWTGPGLGWAGRDSTGEDKPHSTRQV